jgi:dTDP-4-amino-4,6-dideoxy-D-galactose acyltransferase
VTTALQPGVATLLEWDTRFFGFPIARANLNQLAPDSAAALLDWCQAQGVACLYFLADMGDAPTIRLAEAHGFTWVDLRLTLTARLNGEAGEAGQPPGPEIGPVQPGEVEALQRLARESHYDSRFFFDQGFPHHLAARLYEVWIAQSCQGGSALVLAARDQDTPIGYLACDQVDARTGQVSLFAVDARYRGQGVGRALLRASLHWFREHQLETVRVVTQGRNVPALRLYERAGFQTETIQAWYHRWFAHNDAAKPAAQIGRP